MKRLLFLFLLLPFIGISQTQVIINEHKDTITQVVVKLDSAGSKSTTIKVARTSYVDSVVNVSVTYPITRITQTIKPYNPTTPPINNPPIVSGGGNKTVTLPNGITLTGTATDPDGSIASVKWIRTATGDVLSNTYSVALTFPIAGAYVYTFQAIDNEGASALAQVTVTVNPATPINTPPKSNAGTDKTITLPTNSVVMNGSASDAEGTVGTGWTRKSGPTTFTFSNQTTTATLSGLIAGTYVFRLSATDLQGVTATDDVSITVKPAVTPPTGTPINISVSQLSSDYTSPGRGFGGWYPVGGPFVVAIPGVQMLDFYDRFGWGQLDKSFSALEAKIRQAINAKAKFGFGVMTYLPGAVQGWKEAITYSDGTVGMTPESVHNAAMATSNQKDTRTGSTWCPNWNFEGYVAGWEAFHIKLYNWLNTTSYNEVKYKDAVAYYEIRGYGRYGEWNMYEDNKPKATEASLMRIINGVKNAFPDVWLLTLTDGYMPNTNNDCTPLVSYTLMTGRNAKGKFGARKDHMGSQYYPDEDWKYNGNSTVYNGVKLGDVFRDGWKEAPYTGEPALGNSNNYTYMKADIDKYHFSEVGNGNYGQQAPSGSTTARNVIASNPTTGYRYTVVSGSITPGTGTASITLNWNNAGNAPTYEDWNVTYEFKSGSTVVKTATSSLNLRQYLPGTKSVTDVIGGIPAGTYTVTLKIVDQKAYRNNMALSLNGRAADGSYTLLQNLIVQ